MHQKEDKSSLWSEPLFDTFRKVMNILGVEKK